MTPLLVYFTLQYVHWRTAFLLFGLLGVAWAVAFFIWYQDDPRTHPGMNAAEAALLPQEPPAAPHHLAVPWALLLRSKTVWCLCGQYAALSYVWYFFITWFPKYLMEARGFDMKQSAWLAGTPLLLGGFGSLAAGWLGPWLGRRVGVRPARCGLGAFGFVTGAALLVVSTRLADPYLAVGAIALVSFFNDLALPGSWAACMDVGGAFVATLGGAMNMMGNFGGMLSPIVAGYVVEQTGSWTGTFYVAAGAYVLGALCWLALDPVTPLEEQARGALA